MALDKKDLDNIRVVVKDIVDFAISQSEQRTDQRFDKIEKKFENQENRIVKRINREISDIAEMNREFLSKMDNHEIRIETLETKVLT